MTSPVQIKPHLDRLLETFDASHLEPDPLAAVNHLDSPDDLEIACLFAALFAYGRADLIQRNVAAVVSAMGPSPARFCDTYVPSRRRNWMRGFVYRFHRREDLVALVGAVKRTREEHGSVLNAFLRHDDPSAETILPGLAGMARTLRRHAGRGSNGFSTLAPDPAAGGASKRWALYLRWMVRKDRVDPGPWSGQISPARLVMPLDVHVGRIARRLGMLQRKSNDWKAAVELTAFLRRLDPDDPVKYDFALYSYGKLGYCVSHTNHRRCVVCDFNRVCSRE